MKCLTLALIFLPIAALAQQATPPVQALAAMLQECGVREANARVGAAMFQENIASLKTENEDLKKQLKTAHGEPAEGNH